MASLPVEILLGVYLGVLTGVIPGLVAWALGFTFRYLTGVTIPGFGVVVLGLALAGVNGGLLALADPTIRQNTTGAVVVVAIVVVTMVTLYAHAKGDAMGATFPRRVSLRNLRDRTLSADVVDLVGGRSQVRVEVVGAVADIEGYPSLPADLRQSIREGDWRLPADLPLGELEGRLAERLRTEFDLTDVAVSIDERGRATVAAAPPLSGLSKRVPADQRAVSVEGLVPTGVARGDVVRLVTDAGTVTGTVLSARCEGSPASPPAPPHSPSTLPDGGEPLDQAAVEPVQAPTTTGGEGRVTVAVSRSDAELLLGSERARIVVTARGTTREFELVSLLRRSGRRFRKVTVRADGPLDGTTVGEAGVWETYSVGVLAVRRPDGWVIAPRGTTELHAGDDLFAVGRRDPLAAFAEAVA